jgi:hypothetical protein
MVRLTRSGSLGIGTGGVGLRIAVDGQVLTSAAARCGQVDGGCGLATPPFWLATAITRPIELSEAELAQHNAV